MRYPNDSFPSQPLMRRFYNGATHAAAASQLGAWLKGNFPDVYANAALSNPRIFDSIPIITPPAPRSGLSGLGDEATVPTASGGGFFTEWGKTISDAAAQIIALKNQKDLIDLNIKRAEQGLPPIDTSGIAPQVNFGLSPQVQKIVIGSVVGLGVVFLASKLLGSK